VFKHLPAYINLMRHFKEDQWQRYKISFAVEFILVPKVEKGRTLI
jgi:hypothetical protein